jgi:hypothetical protein
MPICLPFTFLCYIQILKFVCLNFRFTSIFRNSPFILPVYLDDLLAAESGVGLQQA